MRRATIPHAQTIFPGEKPLTCAQVMTGARVGLEYLSPNIWSQADPFTYFLQSLLLLDSLPQVYTFTSLLSMLQLPANISLTPTASYPVPEKNRNLITPLYFFPALGGLAWALWTSLLWQLGLAHDILRGCDSEPHARLFLTIHCLFSFLCLEFPSSPPCQLPEE